MEKILPATTEWKGVPYVGCAATIPVGSDCYPGTVVWVSEKTIKHTYKDRKTGEEFIVDLPRKIRIAGCRYRATQDNCYTENQGWQYYDDGSGSDGGTEYSYREQRKNYVAVGTPWRSTAAQAPGFGYRRMYRDPSF